MSSYIKAGIAWSVSYLGNNALIVDKAGHFTNAINNPRFTIKPCIYGVRMVQVEGVDMELREILHTFAKASANEIRHKLKLYSSRLKSA